MGKIFFQADQLGLGPSVIPVRRSHSRLIFTNQHGLLELPSGPSWLLRAKDPFTRPLLPSLMKEVFTRRRETEEEETVHQFANRRLGKEVYILYTIGQCYNHKDACPLQSDC